MSTLSKWLGGAMDSATEATGTLTGSGSLAIPAGATTVTLTGAGGRGYNNYVYYAKVPAVDGIGYHNAVIGRTPSGWHDPVLYSSPSGWHDPVAAQPAQYWWSDGGVYYEGQIWGIENSPTYNSDHWVEFAPTPTGLGQTYNFGWAVYVYVDGFVDYYNAYVHRFNSYCAVAAVVAKDGYWEVPAVQAKDGYWDDPGVIAKDAYWDVWPIPEKAAYSTGGDQYGTPTTATLNGTTRTWTAGYGTVIGPVSTQSLTSNGLGQTLTYAVGSEGSLTYAYTY
jgi:hypothetical protein